MSDDRQADLDIEVNIAAQLIGPKQSARIRTGKRRTEAAGRKLLKAGAEKAGVEVSVAKHKGYLEAKVK